MSTEISQSSGVSMKKRVALIAANPAVSSTTRGPVGFWWSEVTHPWLAFHEAGYEVELFSPFGGPVEGDGLSDPNDPSGYSKYDLITQGFLNTSELKQLVSNTRAVRDLDVQKFDAIVVAGGQAPLFTFEDAKELQEKFVEFYTSGKIAAALCHGVALLRYTRLPDGELLVKGKNITGFTNEEEDMSDEAVWNYGILPRGKHVMPWRIEDELNKLGGHFIKAAPWKSFAVRDGNLITGQQNFSGRQTAELIISALEGHK